MGAGGQHLRKRRLEFAVDIPEVALMPCFPVCRRGQPSHCAQIIAPRPVRFLIDFAERPPPRREDVLDADRGARARTAERSAPRNGQACRAALDGGLEQQFLAAEVIVQQRHVRFRLAGNHAMRWRMKANIRDEHLGGIQQRFPGRNAAQHSRFQHRGFHFDSPVAVEWLAKSIPGYGTRPSAFGDGPLSDDSHAPADAGPGGAFTVVIPAAHGVGRRSPSHTERM